MSCLDRKHKTVLLDLIDGHGVLGPENGHEAYVLCEGEYLFGDRLGTIPVLFDW